MPASNPSARFRATVAAALLAVALPLHAQFGALRRAVEQKAGERVEQRADDRANVALLQPPTFDGTTVELTDAILDGYVAAYTRLGATRATRQAEADRLHALASAQEDSARAIESRNERDRQRHERSADTWRTCADRVRDERDAAAEKAAEAFAARLQANPVAAQNDPTMRKATELMTRMAAAQSRGDGKEVERIQGELQKVLGSIGTADSASTATATRTRCGAEPATPAWVVQATALHERSRATRALANAKTASAGRPSAADLGLTDVQAAMVEERIASWLGGMRASAPLTVRFTRAEYDRLVSRRDAIRRAKRG